MGTAVTSVHQGLALQQRRRLVALAGAVGTVIHPGQAVRYHLPGGWTMKPSERAQAATLLSNLTTALDPNGPFVVDGTEYDGQQAKGALLTKMIDGLAGAAQRTAGQATATIEMYGDAIEELPAWAIDAAIRRWAQGKCPESIEERPKYAWPPAPAVLRQMAELELVMMRRERQGLERLLACVTFEEAMDPDFQMPTNLGSMALLGLRSM